MDANLREQILQPQMNADNIDPQITQITQIIFYGRLRPGAKTIGTGGMLSMGHRHDRCLQS
jgi:hypothetical protein